ncbi:hypothetical protein AVEN_188368-1 [Araneus ventricosus]|uniref:Uncharacterized protein n=1 Tax=Araneus ventricosus TaxID=182803 RepID=A0A4Y2H987_ARAVE|nr:hypothetical protein AVEN_188368-1 [Araneus ventricosus]
MWIGLQHAAVSSVSCSAHALSLKSNCPQVRRIWWVHVVSYCEQKSPTASVRLVGVRRYLVPCVRVTTVAVRRLEPGPFGFGVSNLNH